MCQVRDDAQIVGDEERGDMALGLEILEEPQDLRLGGDVERRRRLVGDHQSGLARERHRDEHALAHPARQLVRVALKHVGRIRNAEAPEEPDHLGVGRLARQAAVDPQRIRRLKTDTEDRIERRERILRNERDLGSAEPPHLGLGQSEEIPALQSNRAALDPSGRGQEPDDGPADRRLPCPGLPHEPEHLTGAQPEVDPPRGEPRAVADREPLDLQRRNRHSST